MLIKQKENNVGFALSDLHLGKLGSVGRTHIRKLSKLIDNYSPSTIYLNGDIIEVSNLTGTREDKITKMAASLDLVDEMLDHGKRKNPQLATHYIMGDHDNFIELRDKLLLLKEKHQDNLFIEISAVKSPNALNLHGNIGLISGENECKEDLLQTINDNTLLMDLIAPPVTWVKSLLDTRLSDVKFTTGFVAERIYNKLKEVNPDLLEGTEYIISGHIHPPGHPTIKYNDIEFIFTGPSTMFSKAPLYKFDIDEEAKYSDFKPIELSKFNSRESDRTHFQNKPEGYFSR